MSGVARFVTLYDAFQALERAAHMLRGRDFPNTADDVTMAAETFRVKLDRFNREGWPYSRKEIALAGVCGLVVGGCTVALLFVWFAL